MGLSHCPRAVRFRELDMTEGDSMFNVFSARNKVLP